MPSRLHYKAFIPDPNEKPPRIRHYELYSSDNTFVAAVEADLPEAWDWVEILTHKATPHLQELHDFLVEVASFSRDRDRAARYSRSALIEFVKQARDLYDKIEEG